ncbi:hypothetical protein IFM89_034431 [Coptis chinensis]|uniref:Uncharacterized protein n=1 Tax=Coptis chinensis TaxID=261450 RepID=A0A835ME90_9MAGN|nr:hypothetical protein IFM89_034431 [Coptis chinensis]
MRNFLWSGDPSIKKGVTIAWDKVCKPYREGGLGIRKLGEVNRVMLMKLVWRFLEGKDDFAIFMQNKYLTRDDDVIGYYRPTSIWQCIKEAMREVRPRTQWAIGSGNLVDIWKDNWLGSAPLRDALNLTSHELKDCNSKVSTLIVNGYVQIPSNFQALITTAGLTTDGILKWNDGDRDTYLVPLSQREIQCYLGISRNPQEKKCE